MRLSSANWGRDRERGKKKTHVVQNHKRLGPTTLPVADGVEDTTTDDSAEELLNEESQEDTADEGQVEVVD